MEGRRFVRILPSSPVTPAELRIMRLRATGMSVLETAHAAGVKPQTVKSHIGSVLRKLHVDSSTAAYGKLGWLHVPGLTHEGESCGFIAQCGRAQGHRGQHGGFR